MLILQLWYVQEKRGRKEPVVSIDLFTNITQDSNYDWRYCHESTRIEAVYICSIFSVDILFCYLLLIVFIYTYYQW